MNKLLIVKNITREGPGLLQEELDARNIGYDLVDLDKGEEFPSPTDYRGLVVLGGPDSANDNTEKMTQELARIREALADNIPYLGICLGLQALVKAAGGAVVKSPIKEVGFKDPNGENFKVNLTSAGQLNPLFYNLEDSFNVFHLHGETVELTEDMTLLATGKFCRNQIAKIGDNAYGIQCHFELTPTMFEEWIGVDPDLLELDTKQLSVDYEAIRAKYDKVGRQLFSNFLKIAGY